MEQRLIYYKVDYHHPQNSVPDPNAPVGSPELKAWDDVKGLTLDKIRQAHCHLLGRNTHSQHILASPLWRPLPIAYGMPFFFYSYLQYVPFFHPEEYNVDGREVEKIYVFAPDQFILGYKEQKKQDEMGGLCNRAAWPRIGNHYYISNELF